jgi:hypothetical protein
MRKITHASARDCNNRLAVSGVAMQTLLFSPRPRQRRTVAACNRSRCDRLFLIPRGAEESCRQLEGSGVMQKFHALLRSAPRRIGRRLKLIVAIAAASLPSAGA